MRKPDRRKDGKSRLRGGIGEKMVILYEVYENLYVNMTNKCPCACTFCLRQTMDEMNHSGRRKGSKICWKLRHMSKRHSGFRFV